MQPEYIYWFLSEFQFDLVDSLMYYGSRIVLIDFMYIYIEYCMYIKNVSFHDSLDYLSIRIIYKQVLRVTALTIWLTG